VTVITSLLHRSSHHRRAEAGYPGGMVDKTDRLRSVERVIAIVCILEAFFVAQASWHYLFG